MVYKDRTWCKFEECVKHDPSRCDRVLSDWDLKRLRGRPMMIAYFGEKPDCFFSGKGLSGRE